MSGLFRSGIPICTVEYWRIFVVYIVYIHTDSSFGCCAWQQLQGWFIILFHNFWYFYVLTVRVVTIDAIYWLIFDTQFWQRQMVWTRVVVVVVCFDGLWYVVCGSLTWNIDNQCCLSWVIVSLGWWYMMYLLQFE